MNKLDDKNNNIYLYELKKELNLFLNLFENDNFPKVSLLSGRKGIGKFTLILFFLNNIFNQKKSFFNKKFIEKDSIFYNQILLKTDSNIIYLNNENHNIKIEDIRELKKTLQKTSISNLPRFIILDDVELFNASSLNAMLKIIEEPNHNNYFILINNEERKILETIKSRCLETKIILNNSSRIKIIDSLVVDSPMTVVIDYNNSDITPGNFLKYNKICLDNEINLNNTYFIEISKILKFYKKDKNLYFVNLAYFFTEQYFYKKALLDKGHINYLNSTKIKFLKYINDFVTYNLNLESVINFMQTNFKYEK